MSNTNDKPVEEEAVVHHRDDAARYCNGSRPDSEDFNHDLDQLQRFIDSKQQRSDKDHAADKSKSDFSGLVIFGFIVLAILSLIPIIFAVLRHVSHQPMSLG